MHAKMRSIYLLRIYLQSLWRKIAYDLIREIVLILCATTLLSLFFYIFHDFIYVKIADLSASFREGFATRVGQVLLILVTAFIARWLHQDSVDARSLAHFSERLGEDNAQIRWFRVSKALVILFASYGLYWFSVSKYLVMWDLKDSLIHQCCAIIGIVLLRYFLPRLQPFIPRFKPRPLLDTNEKLSKIESLVIWRLKQLTLRNRASLTALFMAFAMSTVQWFVAFTGLPSLLSVPVAMFSGLFVAAALAFQLEADIHNAWLDRLLTVSHAEYERAYVYIAVILGTAFAAINTSPFLLHASFDTASDILKVFMINVVGPLTFPSLMFQLDARKPVLTMISIFIITLFVSTTVYVSLLGFLLIPLLHYYASNYQSNNFYRS